MIGLGEWRFFLAFCVVISHLYNKMVDGPAAYAVWGFYVLSGFLMTFVLNEKYHFNLTGIKHYTFNRIIRIYPSYLFSLILGAIAFYVCIISNTNPRELNPQFYMPNNLSGWIVNIFMLFPFDQTSLLVPVAGALYVEIFSYLIMPITARSKATVWTFAITSFLANYQFGFGMDTFGQRYAGVATCMFAFSVGSSLYFYKPLLSRLSFPNLSVVAWIGNCVLWFYFPAYPWTYGLYISVILSAWVVLSLFNKNVSNRDKLLGDMSYSIYLLHTTIAAFFASFLGTERTFLLFFLSFVTVIIVSYYVVVLIERKFQRIKFK